MGSNRNRPAAAVGHPPERDMDESERDDERDDDRDDDRAQRGGSSGPPAPVARSAGGSPFAIYKPGQGTYVRWGSAAGAALIAVAGIFFVNEQLSRFAFIKQQMLLTVQAVASVALLVAAGVLIFWLVGRKRNFVDFLVATEGEMKKVNWSTRREVIGATKVVIVTVLALSFILFVVDLFFIFFFSTIGVLKVDILKGLFGGGG